MSCLDAVIECLDMNLASDGGTILAAVLVSNIFVLLLNMSLICGSRCYSSSAVRSQMT
jgi:hypothetical protein